MRWRIVIGALFVIAASGECCLAADPRYPDWPCVQAKVPEISLAAVWAGPPLDDATDKWKNDAKVERAGAEIGRTEDAARGSQEGDHRISRGLAG